MGTRSAICYRRPGGLIVGVYCHWDGYPEHQLPILQEHYPTLVTTRALIKRGWLSVLRTDHDWERNPKAPGPLYYKDRGDEWADVKPVTYVNVWKAMEEWRNSDCEHLYLFIPGRGGKRGEWQHYALPFSN